MDVVVLAAGLGKRMRSALPKVLQPVAGRPMLTHVLDSARTLVPRALCVVIGHGGDAVRQVASADDVRFAVQTQQLGTGHAVRQALPELDPDGADTVMVLYGDVPLVSAGTLQALAAAGGTDALALLTVRLADPTGYGRIVRNEVGAVECIVEQKDASPRELLIDEVNTGMLVAPFARLKTWLEQLRNNNAQGEFYLTDIVAMAVSEGMPVRTVQPSAPWETLGANDRRQLAELERQYQCNAAERLMADGVSLIDPHRFDLRGSLQCGRDVEIDVNCVFEGDVKLGDDVRVGANCVLRNVSIGAGSRIAPFSHLEDSEMGRACVIGPYARTRPGTYLGDDVHLGNFVEVKNSRIGNHSKANHLAYVGDAQIGVRVNVGAGTITCNYDGANKHLTVIEDDVFIGSDTQLVAPVRVGRGATLGAGTTLTKDAPADQLTVSRARQISLSGWKRPEKPPKR